MSKEQKKPEGTLQNVITFFCFKTFNSITKLVKLCYLADVYYYQMHGKRLTDIPFKHYRYGPWAKEVGMALEELYEKGIIKENKVQTKKGQIATIPRPNISQAEITLSKDKIEILQDVVIDWGEVPTDKIVDYCKKTLPFLKTPFNERINFSRTNEIKEFARKKKISEEHAATLDVISNKKILSDTLKAMEDIKKGKFLNYNSVFE